MSLKFQPGKHFKKHLMYSFVLEKNYFSKILEFGYLKIIVVTHSVLIKNS